MEKIVPNNGDEVSLWEIQQLSGEKCQKFLILSKNAGADSTLSDKSARKQTPTLRQ